MIYGGMDPGNKGAIVAMDERAKVVYQHEIPLLNIGKGRSNKWVLDPQGLLRCLLEVRGLGEPLFFVLEKAQVMAPGGGGQSPASARSMFQYGRGYGCMEMALIALGIPYEAVHPKTWGNQILRGIEGGDTKARAILKAQRAIPTLDLTPGRKRTPHDGLADAACMCLYGMMLRPVPGAGLVVTPSSAASTNPQRALPPGPPRRKTPPPPRGGRDG